MIDEMELFVKQHMNQAVKKLSDSHRRYPLIQTELYLKVSSFHSAATRWSVMYLCDAW